MGIGRSNSPLKVLCLDGSLKAAQQPLPRAIFRVLRCILLIAAVFGCLCTLSFIKLTLGGLQERDSCDGHPCTAFTKPVIGKITASYGPADPVYEAALSTHTFHNALHGYPHFILREQMVRGLWSKHTYLLAIIGTELAKPEAERLRWLFWHDRDTILMNSNIPLDAFLPPDTGFGHINLLVTRDKNGLNNGAFFVRVDQWALRMLASALSIREYQPDIPLKYTEQSGMEETLRRPWWNSSVAYVPQHWFNGFPPSPKSKKSPSAARPGSMLIHFASNRDGLRPERMIHWGEIARSKAPDWYKPFNETGYVSEIAEYWGRLAKQEDMGRICSDMGKRFWK